MIAKKVNTVLLDDLIYWLQKNGGASRYWYELSSRLIQSGVEVYQMRRLEATPNPWALALNPERSIAAGKTNIKISRYLDCSFPRELKSQKSTFVFHSSHYRVPLDKTVANVVTVHDFTYEMYKSGLALAVHVWQKKRAIRHADVVICISEFTKVQLIKLYPEFADKRIEVIYHGVGVEFFREEDRPEEPSNEVVFLGVRDSYKRFDLAIDAARHLPDKVLAVVGPSLSPEEKVDLDAKIPGRWKHYGRLSDEALRTLYNCAFCFVYPSDSEGFGLPLLEAMRAGCPVVCANLTVFPEIAGDAALFAAEQTGAAYAQQMARLNDTDLRAEMIAHGLERVLLFSWENCFNKTLDAYQLALQIRLKGVSA
ncbi:MAG: glycosyltransferase family 4 protein [Limnohabitans sp.]